MRRLTQDSVTTGDCVCGLHGAKTVRLLDYGVDKEELDNSVKWFSWDPLSSWWV